MYIYIKCSRIVLGSAVVEKKKRKREAERAACLYIITILTDTVRTLPNNVLDPHHMHVTLSLPALPVGARSRIEYASDHIITRCVVIVS